MILVRRLGIVPTIAVVEIQIPSVRGRILRRRPVIRPALRDCLGLSYSPKG